MSISAAIDALEARRRENERHLEANRLHVASLVARSKRLAKLSMGLAFLAFACAAAQVALLAWRLTLP